MTIAAWRDRDRLIVRAPYGVGVRLREVPTGRWDRALSAWSFAASRVVARKLLPITGALDAVAALAGEQPAPPREDAIALPDGGVPRWRHQTRGAWWLADRDAALLQYGMGCLAGDSVIHVNRGGKGFRMTIADLIARELRGWPKRMPTFVRGMKADGTLGLVRLVGVKATGYRHALELSLDNGQRLTLTPRHEIATPSGKVAAETLKVGDAVLIDEVGWRGFDGRPRKARPYLYRRLSDGRRLSRDGYVIFSGSRVRGSPLLEHRVVAAAMLGRQLHEGEVVHHRNGDKTDNRPENLEVLSGHSEHGKRHQLRDNLAGALPRVAHVASIRHLGAAIPVYDLSVDDPAHTYVANGIVVGNTGKTRIALDALGLIGAQTALVLCPLSVVSVWKSQAARWYPHPAVAVLDLDAGGVARKARTMRGFLMPPRAARLVVAVVNYESAWRPALGEAILEREWDAVIYDECHRIKSPSSSASMFAAKLRPKVRRRWALSGTPLAHSPMDAYAIFRALDPGVFGTSFARFRAEYAVMGGFQGKQVLGYRNLDGFRESYYTLALAQDRDVLDLPPTHHVELTATLEPPTRRLYEQLRTEFVAELGGGTVTAAHALTRMLRLQQLTGGALDSDEGAPLHRSAEKESALADFLIDLDPAEPVVVFARFRADLAAVRRAAQRAGRRVRELSGSARELAEWQADGDGSVLATQIQSGGEGIDLTRAAHCVYYSLGFSLAQYEQSLARTHRPGQTRPVTYYHLIASSSIDRYVYRTLRQRRDVINRVLEEGLTDEG